MTIAHQYNAVHWRTKNYNIIHSPIN